MFRSPLPLNQSLTFCVKGCFTLRGPTITFLPSLLLSVCSGLPASCPWQRLRATQSSPPIGSWHTRAEFRSPDCKCERFRIHFAPPCKYTEKPIYWHSINIKAQLFRNLEKFVWRKIFAQKRDYKLSFLEDLSTKQSLRNCNYATNNQNLGKNAIFNYYLEEKENIPQLSFPCSGASAYFHHFPGRNASLQQGVQRMAGGCDGGPWVLLHQDIMGRAALDIGFGRGVDSVHHIQGFLDREASLWEMENWLFLLIWLISWDEQIFFNDLIEY